MLDRLPSRVQPNDDVIGQTLEDEVVLMKLTTQQYFGLDEVGAYAWRLLIENGDVATVADRLCESYAGEPATIRSDFHALVGQLMNPGLLKAVDDI